MSSKQKLLVISERGLGDAITLLPSLCALKECHPVIEIEMLAPGLYALAENLQETVRIIDHRPIAEMAADEKAGWLRNQGYEWVWNTENQKSAWRPILDEAKNPRWISSLPHRKWPRRPVLDIRLQQLRELFPDLNQYREPKLPLLPAQKTARSEFRTQFPENRRLVAIHPGGADPHKVWSPEKFRQLAYSLIASGNITVLFFIGALESQVFTLEFLPEEENLLRVSEPLTTLLPKLASCDLFIGNDSGFYHLAFALGLKTVGIYSRRKSVRMWAYSSVRSKAVCFPLPKPLRRHWKEVISVDRVLNASLSVLDVRH